MSHKEKIQKRIAKFKAIPKEDCTSAEQAELKILLKDLDRVLANYA